MYLSFLLLIVDASLLSLNAREIEVLLGQAVVNVWFCTDSGAVVLYWWYYEVY